MRSVDNKKIQVCSIKNLRASEDYVNLLHAKLLKLGENYILQNFAIISWSSKNDGAVA